MDKSYLLKDKPELGEEGYTENVAETQVLCSCQKTGIMIIRKAGSDEKVEHI
jgi:hypothetical protein